MILSRSNLLAVHGTSKDSPILDNLHVTQDGSTVAFDGRALLVVSPITDEMEERVTLKDTGKPTADTGVTVSSASVREVLKNLPADKKFDGVREHVDLSPSGVFTIDDGMREKTITAKVYPRQFVDYKSVLRNAKKSKNLVRVVLNGKRLRNLLEMIDKICPDSSGDSPVFLEFTEDNDIVLRAVNPLTSQRCIGYIASYKNEEGQWLPEDRWEKSLAVDVVNQPNIGKIMGGSSAMRVGIDTTSNPDGTTQSQPKKSVARKLNNEWRQ